VEGCEVLLEHSVGSGEGEYKQRRRRHSMSDLGLDVSRDGRGPFSKKGGKSDQDTTAYLISDVCRRLISKEPVRLPDLRRAP